MIRTRRGLLGGALAFGSSVLFAGPGRPQAGSLFPFKDDRGAQVYNYRLPADLSTEGLPGIIWVGAAAPEVILVEFFDYNCPYCRAASGDLQALLDRSPALRLGLVNNPVLAAGSVQAAKVQQAVLRSYGPEKAYAFHRALFEAHGPMDGPSALAVATKLGLDAKKVETEGDLPQIGAVLERQSALARALGFEATPSFMADGIGILGYPGPQAMARAIDQIRRCDKLVCQAG